MTHNFSPLNCYLCDSISFIRLLFHNKHKQYIGQETLMPFPAPLLQSCLIYTFTKNILRKTQEMAF